jgi:cytochrome c oxidase subunit 3
MSNIKNKFDFKYLNTTHQFHLVDPSPWPLLASLGAFMFTTGGVLFMHKVLGGWGLFLNGFTLIIFVMYVWWRDVVREATYEEQHTFVVQRGLRLGMILFIVSEVMFFFAFFWAFFHSSLAPVFNIGGVWPPKAIIAMNTYTIPLTNTFILLSSGATVTWAHHAVILNAKRHTIISLIYTLALATLFTTGFHGFHVFVGTIALFVSFVRIVLNHSTNTHHFGFESAIWYWHFVDVVWLFLFINIYWWGNLEAYNLSANVLI